MAARLSALCLSAATLTRQLCGFPAHSKQHEKGCCFYRNETGNTQQKQVAKFTKEVLSTEDIWKRLERSYLKKCKILNSDNFTSFSEDLLHFNETGD